jgi:glycyl-tRNA synthetase
MIDIIVKTFVQERDDILLMDAALLMHPKVREASGHVATFNDPLIDDKNTGERFRADHLIETHIEEIRNAMSDEDLLLHIQKTIDIPNLVPDSWSVELMYEYFKSYGIKNPNGKKTPDRTEVRKFSLMLSTQL